jgi:hypothetical protein
MTDEPLTVEPGAERLQRHADTVRRYLIDGQLPGRNITVRQWRVSADALNACIERGDNLTAAKAPE